MSIDLRPGATALESPKPVPMALEVASHWTAISSALTQTQAVQNASIPPESWTGAAADAASAEIQALGGKLSDLAGAFPGPANSLKTWEDRNNQGIRTIEGLQQQWDEAIATYKKRIAEINAHAASDKEYNPAPDRKAARDTLSSAQAPLKKSYNDEIHQLSDAADTAAKQIQETSDRTISPDAVKGGRAAVGAALFGTGMPICDGAAEWDYARTKAPELRDDLVKAANSHKPLTEAEVKKLQEKWGDKLQNPYWVQALGDAYRAKYGKDANFSDMLNRLAINAAGSSPDDPSSGGTRNQLMASVGSAMVLATGGFDASAGAIDTNAAYQTVRAGLRGVDGTTTIAQMEANNIADFKETGSQSYERFPGQGATAQFNGFDVFTQLTGYAAAKNPDLTLGAGVYHAAPGETSLASDIMAYDHQAQRGYKSLYGGVADDVSRYSLIAMTKDDARARGYALDPMQSLYMLSDTPDALQDGAGPASMQKAETTRLMYLRSFLDGDTPFDVDLPDGAGKDGPINVARYLTGNRNQGGPGAFLGTVDGGDALGDMLNDASNPRTASAAEPVASDFPDDPDHKQFKAAHDIWARDARARPTIAANTMAGYQDGLSRDNSGGWGSGAEDKTKQGEDIYGNHNSRLRSWMGSIISPYAGDLADQMHNNSQPGMQAGSLIGDDKKAHMRFSRDMVDRFKGPGGLLQDLAFDQPEVIKDSHYNNGNPLDDSYVGGRMPALKAVQVAAYTGYMNGVSQAMEEPDYGVRTSLVNRTTDIWTELIQETFDADADKNVEVQRQLDKSNEEARKIADFIVDKGVGYASSKVPVGGDLLQQAIKSAAGKGEDAWWPTDNESKAWDAGRDDTNKSAHQLMQRGLTRAMYDSPHWTERGGTVDVSPGSQGLANKGFSFVNPDGTVKPYDSLTDDERATVYEYFKGVNSDFHDVLDHQYQVQQDAEQDGAVSRPKGK
mgnify:CR=1 FL=1